MAASGTKRWSIRVRDFAMEDVIEGKDFCFPAEEREVLKQWDATDAFHEQLRRTEGMPEYIFYDGPPFATGLPHYGHLLAGTLKVCAQQPVIPIDLPHSQYLRSGAHISPSGHVTR